MIAVILVISLFSKKQYIDSAWSINLLVILNCMGLVTYYIAISFLENRTWTLDDKYRISNNSYKTLLVFVIAISISYYVLNNNHQIQLISPLFVIINMSTAIIVLLEFFIISQFLLIFLAGKFTEEEVGVKLEEKNGKLKMYKYFLILITIVLIKFVFLSSINEHRIWTTPTSLSQPAPTNRMKIKDYFETWEQSRDSLSKNDSTIYLVSAQGGGSRAAAWAFINLVRLDTGNRDTHFFENLFSISTVSGSTSGVNMYLAAKYYNRNIKDSDVLGLYGANYMSSAFYGLMMGDGLESILHIFDNQVKDRNYYLQQEEEAAFNKTYKLEDANDFFEKDFMFPYKKNKHFPLFMINTTLLDYGTRAVFSPIQLDSISMARDIYGEFRKDNCNDQRDIPMVTCVNQSQAFPLISSYNYVECTGRLGDGGFSENSGCGTTLELYRALRKLFDNSEKYKHYKIVCVNLMNSSMKDSYNAAFTRASALTTLTAAIHSPFDGNQNYAYKNLSLQIDYMRTLGKNVSKDTCYNFNLDTTITLTRTLSKKSVERMLNHIDTCYKLHK